MKSTISTCLFAILVGAAATVSGVENECICHREYLTGDMFGLRSGLAERKVNVDLDLTQFYQGVASGGREQRDAYGGKLDYFFTILDGLVVMHAETRFGEDVILDAAGAAPVNENMLYPGFEDTTAITGLQVNLPLTSDQEWILTGGKINTLDLLSQVYPQVGRGVDSFMNASSVLPLSVARTLPLSFLGAGVMKMREKQLEGALLVYDSHNIMTTSGFDELFDNGANIAGAWRFFTEFGGRPGSHLFLGTWASGQFTSLDPSGWSFLPEVGIVPGRQSGSWSLLYILEQQLWADPCNKQRNVGLMSQWGIADPETCPLPVDRQRIAAVTRAAAVPSARHDGRRLLLQRLERRRQESAQSATVGG